MTAIVWHSNGLGQWQSTDWLPMDTPVGPILVEAGPEGWMEFGEQGVRFWRPFNWVLG